MSDPLIDILVVDDDQVDLEIVTRILRKVSDAISVQTACGGQEALDYLLCKGSFESRRGMNYPRLILLDLKMPLVDGVDVLRGVRGDERTRCIPVVMLSASVHGTDITNCYRAGANGYLRKECGHEALREMLQHVCEFWLQHNRVAETESVRS